MAMPEFGTLPGINQPNGLLSPRFEVEFEYYWSSLSSGMEHLVSRNTFTILKRQTLEKEKTFYNTVFALVDSVARTSYGEIVCLFDIDGTLGEVKEERSDHLHTILRPSAVPLITELAVKHPEYLRFGLISNRPQRSLDEEMNNPTFLTPIRPFMDSKLVFSSRQEERTDPLMQDAYDFDYLIDVIDSLRGLVNDTLLDQTLSGALDFREWYDPKIKMLAKLAQESDSNSIIYVDNLPCAAVFSATNERIKGIDVSALRPLLLPEDI
ncbi:MAG: hypothetical protein NVS1B7_0220 [Candidatus Saccharimonadales bacterium]